MILYSLASSLHSGIARSAMDDPFIASLQATGIRFDYRGSDLSTLGQDESLIYIRTGGTEGLFRQAYAGHEGTPVQLLTSGLSNSLAASMEILSWLRAQGIPGRILHGTPEEIATALGSTGLTAGEASVIKPYTGGPVLQGKRYGVIGRPSDWLISSDVDYSRARSILGAELIDIPIEELVSEAARPAGDIPDPELKPLGTPLYGRPISEADFSGAIAIYKALRRMVARYGLDGLTLRCFDLLTALGNTGCMALALLNSEGLVATCEGDVPAMLSMAVTRERYGISGFQVNLSRINGSEYLFAHCTVPLDMVRDYCYDTHFESGIGVAVHGELPLGRARVFKLSADLSRCIDEPVTLSGNTYAPGLCRTQVLVTAPASLKDYFLGSPLGNHHILIPLPQ